MAEALEKGIKEELKDPSKRRFLELMGWTGLGLVAASAPGLAGMAWAASKTPEEFYQEYFSLLSQGNKKAKKAAKKAFNKGVKGDMKKSIYEILDIPLTNGLITPIHPDSDGPEGLVAQVYNSTKPSLVLVFDGKGKWAKGGLGWTTRWRRGLEQSNQAKLHL